MRGPKRSSWPAPLSLRAEDLVRPTLAFAVLWLAFLASIVRPVSILLFVLLPQSLLLPPYLPDRQVVELGDGSAIEILDWSVIRENCTLQYVSDVSLDDRAATERRMERVLSTYAAARAEEEGCSFLELLPIEWCEHGLCLWVGRVFDLRRDAEGWRLIETRRTER